MIALPPTLTMLVGLPGSGKTTYAKKLIETSDRIIKRVNKDELRLMLDNGRFSSVFENFINLVQDEIVSQALLIGYSVILDNTNLKLEDEYHWKRMAYECDAVFIRVPIVTSLETCILRDSKREHPVGEEAIRKMHEAHILEQSKYGLKGGS